MAPRHCFSSWVLVCWLLAAVAEGQEAFTPPGGSQNNADHTDCQIFTLTPPPPTTRSPITRVQPITRTPKCPFHVLPPRRPRIYFRFPIRPFFPPRCNHRFHFQPFYWPHGRLPPYRYFPRGTLRRGSSSEES
ncbi:odontogenesis associated phosphoprotein [Lemur catta]|uniref:odontogenesis associated phosphoprotein n=1 Tax=Lemur catta TaxID=9447 RepID=UPI001E26A843|nr:odontogenesis associated phosphoprotein [Lemur catta]